VPTFAIGLRSHLAAAFIQLQGRFSRLVSTIAFDQTAVLWVIEDGIASVFFIQIWTMLPV
jgi:hypothetical protein